MKNLHTDHLWLARTKSVVKDPLIVALPCSVSCENKPCSYGPVKGKMRIDWLRSGYSPEQSNCRTDQWDAAGQDKMLKPPAARIDDGGLRPQAVPPPRLVRAVELPGAPAYLWPALSESGCGDNIQGRFLGSFGDAALRE